LESSAESAEARNVVGHASIAIASVYFHVAADDGGNVGISLRLRHHARIQRAQTACRLAHVALQCHGWQSLRESVNVEPMRKVCRARLIGPAERNHAVER